MIAVMTPTWLDGAAFVDPQNRPVESAGRLADAASFSLGKGLCIGLDFGGLRSVSSSYFNMLLLGIVSKCGREVFVDDRLTFRFASRAQRDIFMRSYTAVVGDPPPTVL